MEAAAKAGVKFIVLDRVNPINGVTVEGPIHRGHSTFVAYHSIPLRHGMTVGELARMYAAERGLKVDLTVIPLEGWKRAMWFDETGLPWLNPSPNMRSLRAAIFYPGVGLRTSGPVACGNRFWVQSSVHLYCIGDPAVKYDWNPASRPEAVTQSLKKE